MVIAGILDVVDNRNMGGIPLGALGVGVGVGIPCMGMGMSVGVGVGARI